MNKNLCKSCKGSGSETKIINPDWPKGTEPYQELGDCKECEGSGMREIKSDRIKEGSVVQIAPSDEHAFGGCFMYVTERKSFGAQGFIVVPQSRGENPGEAYFRATWGQMTYIGEAEWKISNV